MTKTTCNSISTPASFSDDFCMFGEYYNAAGNLPPDEIKTFIIPEYLYIVSPGEPELLHARLISIP